MWYGKKRTKSTPASRLRKLQSRINRLEKKAELKRKTEQAQAKLRKLRGY